MDIFLQTGSASTIKKPGCQGMADLFVFLLSSP